MGTASAYKLRVRLGTAAGLLLLWSLVLPAARVIERHGKSADALLRRLGNHPLESIASGQRQAFITDIARRARALSFEERRHYWEHSAGTGFLQAMTEVERRHYVRLLLPRSLRAVVETFNSLSRADRELYLEALRRQSAAWTPDGQEGLFDNPIVFAHLVDQGFPLSILETDPASLVGLLPVLDELEHRVSQGGWGP